MCYDFLGDTGNQPNDWTVCPISNFECFTFEDRTSATDLEVVDIPPEALEVRGSGANFTIDLSFIVMSTPPSFYPTWVEMELGVFASTVNVDAYNPSENLIWDDAYSASQWHTVTIDPGQPIAQIHITGGDGETFIATICME